MNRVLIHLLPSSLFRIRKHIFPAVARLCYLLAVQTLAPVLALVADARPAVQIAFIIYQIYTLKIITQHPPAPPEKTKNRIAPLQLTMLSGSRLPICSTQFSGTVGRSSSLARVIFNYIYPTAPYPYYNTYPLQIVNSKILNTGRQKERTAYPPPLLFFLATFW